MFKNFEKKSSYVKPPGKEISKELASKIESINLSDLKTEAVKEILPPICNIVFELKDRIKKGEYSFVIGDDASGHVPALIFYKFIKQIYKEKNQNIKIVFLAGSRDIDQKDFDEKNSKIKDLFQNKLKLQKDSRILLVTDTIYSGETLVPIRDNLNQINIGYDLATVSILNKENLSELQKKFDNNIVYGTYGELQNILGNSVLSGVEKEPKELFAKRKKLDKAQEEYFKAGREDIELAVNKLVSLYKSF